MKEYEALLNKGSQIAGAAVGGAVGSLAGPGGTLAGAAIGAAAGEACVVVLDDLAQRFLSPREEQRVGGVAALAIIGDVVRVEVEGLGYLENTVVEAE